MTREILFKAKRTDNDEWVEGYYANTILTDNPISIGDCRINHLIIENGTMWHIKDSTVSEYSGVTNKHNEKMFENDVFWDDYTEQYFIVEFEDGQFIGRFQDGMAEELSELTNGVLIGSIFDEVCEDLKYDFVNKSD
jgi:hypothetical protein